MTLLLCWPYNPSSKIKHLLTSLASPNETQTQKTQRTTSREQVRNVTIDYPQIHICP